MKTSVKLIAYGLWFGFLVWLSIYGNGYFFDFVGFIKTKVLRTEISPEINFAITFIPWNCFISLLIWFPILFLKRRQLDALREIAAGVIVCFFLVAINLFGVLIWDVSFPESIGNFNGEPTFSVLQQFAVNDGWTPLQFRCAWWMYILVTTAFSAFMPFLMMQIKKEGVIKTLSS
jgi:hypothetical protein